MYTQKSTGVFESIRFPFLKFFSTEGRTCRVRVLMYFHRIKYWAYTTGYVPKVSCTKALTLRSVYSVVLYTMCVMFCNPLVFAF